MMDAVVQGLATATPIKEQNLSKPSYRPEIDGLRAIAVIAVLCSHWIRGFIYPVNWGVTGVYLFFVISGYVITRGLLKEQALNNGKIDLTRFLKNRAIRIWPIYFITIAAIYFIWPGFKEGEVIWHIFFLSDFVFSTPGGTVFPVHFWSLSVEQQYYLLWPLLLIMLRSRLWMACVAMIIISPIAKWHYAELHNASAVLFSLPSNLNCLAAGSLLAIMEIKISPSALKRATGIIGIFSIVLLGLIIYLKSKTIIIADTIFLSTAFAGLSVSAISWLNQRNSKKFLLTSTPLQYIGKISYGIYIYHLIIGYYMITYFSPVDDPVLYTASSAGITLMVSAISWKFIEKPLLALKKRI